MAAKESGEERKIKLAWKRGDEAPGYIMRGQSAVDGAMVYFLHDFTNDLYAYDSRKQQWVWTLECPYYNSSLAMVKGLVTAIGGNEGDPFSTATNKLMSLVDEGGRKVPSHAFQALQHYCSNHRRFTHCGRRKTRD